MVDISGTANWRFYKASQTYFRMAAGLCLTLFSCFLVFVFLRSRFDACCGVACVCVGVMFVFDVNNRASFEDISERWLPHARNEYATTVVKLLCGNTRTRASTNTNTNTTDHQHVQRAVSIEEAEALAEAEGMDYCEFACDGESEEDLDCVRVPFVALLYRILHNPQAKKDKQAPAPGSVTHVADPVADQ